MNLAHAPHGIAIDDGAGTAIYLNAEDATRLWTQLTDMVSLLAYPVLVVDQDAQTSTCPHCAHVQSFDTGEPVAEVDYSHRLNYATVVQDGDGYPYLNVGAADSEHMTAFYVCTSCHRPVDIPEGVGAVWS